MSKYPIVAVVALVALGAGTLLSSGQAPARKQSAL
jgi:hypothetical protein